ncbi:MAG TPA: carboxylesterase family protein [Verrucomicrobiae bacterium]|jgi:para-nitrobenzyl esterase
MTIYPRKTTLLLALFCALTVANAQVQINTPDGALEGAAVADGKVHVFKGIPYAAPPVGPLRWKPPQPLTPWQGVRKATDFGPQAMQARIYSDMIFRDAGPSEDCLYLNVWAPANSSSAKLPVMVWIHGGGFAAGASSEPRQDGVKLCQKGVIVVSMNYRMGIFGFFEHPELTKESEHGASGNYGLMDMVASLQWVKRNISAFGGDPDNVTIFGESAGSFAVSALMASPLSQGLFNRAIGESGAFFGNTLKLDNRENAEDSCVKFATAALGGSSLEMLRNTPAKKLLDTSRTLPMATFDPIIDGYFFPSDAISIFAAGKQSHVALLGGWNRDEGNYKGYFGKKKLDLEHYAEIAKAKFAASADDFLKAYSATTVAEAKRAAQDYNGDQFIAFGTWKWMEIQLKTGGSPVYRYEFENTMPLPSDASPNAETHAPHASEIEFVFGALDSKKLPWRQEDRDVSELMMSYWSNFAKNGDPNGPGLPKWPVYGADSDFSVMHIKASSSASPDNHRSRYLFLDHFGSTP